MPRGRNKKIKKGEENPEDYKKISPKNQILRGMKDIIPADWRYWSKVFEVFENMAREYGFFRIETPVLESTVLFKRTSGLTSDVVEKEMFSFTDNGGDNVSLRPEMTPGVVRAYIEHGMVSKTQPVKMYYISPVFRYNRPQAGRYRQFYQLGCESIGDFSPVLDAQLMIFVYNFYKELGIETSIQVNSIGCQECRPEYRQVLLDYLRGKRKKLCDDCKRRLSKNSLRVLDCKETGCKEVAEDAPQIVDHLCDDCRDHFVKVLENLDELEIPYVLNPKIVRGLDYYTKTTFEIFPVTENDSEQSSVQELGGGGRYDNLSENLGGRSTPAVGFACGVERLVKQLKDKGNVVPPVQMPKIFLAQLGDQAKKRTLRLFEDFRKAKIPVAENFAKGSLKAQLEMANKIGAKFTLILGQKELLEGTILFRDMESGVQETVVLDNIVSEVKKRLK